MSPLIRLARLAYSAERAAAFAYQGHANSVSDPGEKRDLRRIEYEEWAHREHLGRMLEKLGAKPSRLLEIKYACIGKGIAFSCHLIGWFMPMYFAGRLESGNAEEYVTLERLALEQGMEDELDCIREMARVEKTHEVFFLEKVRGHRALGLFEGAFGWGRRRSYNSMAWAAFHAGTKEPA